MRLIDADALWEAFCRSEAIEDAYGSGVLGIIRDILDDMLGDAPTVDATPVRHGHWTHERLVSTSGGTYAVVRCSECQWQHPMWETKFCPNCGAKMEEDDETY